MNLCNYDGELMLADGLGDAMVGVGMRCSQPDVAVYDVKKIIAILMSRDGMTHDEAVEFFEFNISGGWVGEQTPIWMYNPEEGY